MFSLYDQQTPKEGAGAKLAGKTGAESKSSEYSEFHSWGGGPAVGESPLHPEGLAPVSETEPSPDDPAPVNRSSSRLETSLTSQRSAGRLVMEPVIAVAARPSTPRNSLTKSLGEAIRASLGNVVPPSQPLPPMDPTELLLDTAAAFQVQWDAPTPRLEDLVS